MVNTEAKVCLCGFSAGALALAGAAGVLPALPSCLGAGALTLLAAPPPRLNLELLAAGFLGAAFATGLWVHSLFPERWEAGAYICAMSLFHAGEYLSTALFKPSGVSIDSFLLNHSVAYGAAFAVGVAEYALELWLVPGFRSGWVSLAGLGLVVCGDVLRKYAMYTARENFSHIIQEEKADDHELVTNGIYSLFRHPSYVGWFYWSIGTQLLLCNPVSVIGYTVASWQFFADRIPYEESTLLLFFGKDYYDYQHRVPIGIPFVKNGVPAPYYKRQWDAQNEKKQQAAEAKAK